MVNFLIFSLEADPCTFTESMSETYDTGLHPAQQNYIVSTLALHTCVQ